MRTIVSFMLVALLCSGGFLHAQNVFSNSDPLVTYNPNATPGSATRPNQPAPGVMAKWVRTVRMGWSTTNFKSYIWNGMAFRLRFPNNYNPANASKYPVMVFFHGGGETGTIYDNEYHLLLGAQTFQDRINNGEWNGFMLFPQQTSVGWDDNYFSRINGVLDTLQKYNNADPDRIISMGLSSGGYGAVAYAYYYPRRVAAALPSSPAQIRTLSGGIDAYKHIPIWMANGGVDVNPDPYNAQGFYQDFRNAGGNIYQTYYVNNSHNTWTDMWNERNASNGYITSTYWNSAHKAQPLVYFQNQQFCAGGPIAARMGITAGYAAYEWQLNGSTIAGATGNEYTATQAGQYRVRFRRTAGGAWSAYTPSPVVVSTKACTADTLYAEHFTNDNYFVSASGYSIGNFTCQGGIMTSGTDLITQDATGVQGNRFLINYTRTGNGCSFAAGDRVWNTYSPVTVQPNTNYEYSFYLANQNATSPAQIAPTINGVPLIAGYVQATGTGNTSWRKFTYTWNSGGFTYADLALINRSAVTTGNDFAVDEISFKLSPPTAVPSCATNILPANGSTVATQNTAALSWGTVATAASYDVYVWTGATAPASPTANVPTNSYSATGLLPGVMYNWYVAPRNAIGPATGCSVANRSTFTTAIPVPVCATNNLPANGSTVASQTTASLSWGTVATATSYDVYVWTGATAPTTPTASVTTNSYGAAGLTAGTLYNWYVSPKNAGGTAVGCATSSRSAFTTAAPLIPVPGCATNNLPVNGATLATQTTASLGWSSVATATSYDVYVWTGASAPASPTANVATNSYSAAGLTAGTLYNWYVSPKNASGSAAGCAGTNTSTFTTAAIVIPVPGCAINISPANGSTLATQNTASLSWGSVATATSYDVYIWTGATAPASPTVNVATNSYSAAGLTAGTLYNWYVSPKNASGAAVGCATSNRSTFTTATSGAPGTGTGLKGDYYNGITLSGPIIASRIDPTVNFTWPGSPAAGVTADDYTVRWTGKVEAVYSETYTFYTRGDDGIRLWVNGVQLVNDWNYHGTQEFSGSIALVAGQKYDIRMEFFDGCCDGVSVLLWSSASTTKAVVPQIRLYPDAIVIPPAPSCVINSAPVNGSTIATQSTAALSWPAAATATSYDVYLWTGATAPTVPVANVVGTAYNATGLAASALYNWYVVPKNAGGDANGCAVSNRTSFTTAAVPGAGNGTGLKGDYFSNLTLAAPVVASRIDPTVNFIWGGSPAAGIPTDNFSVRWTGKVQPLFTETYRFYTQSDDGVRLWVNGVQLINDWNFHGTQENSGTITLVAGQKYDITLEFFDGCCDGVVILLWSSNSTGKVVIPQSQLYPPDAGLRIADPLAVATPQPAATLTAAVTAMSSTVSPNPVMAGQAVRVRISSPVAAAASLQIINGNGNIISTQKLQLVAGVNTTTVNTMPLGQGIYIVRVLGGDKPLTTKLIIQ